MLEMVIVLGIVGLLAGMVSLHFLALIDSYKLRTAARQLAADIRGAEQAAITEGVNYEVVFDQTAGAYYLGRQAATHTTCNLPTCVKFSKITLPGQKVVCYPIGGVSGVTGGTVILERKGKQLKVVIAPVTGRVSINE